MTISADHPSLTQFVSLMKRGVRFVENVTKKDKVLFIIIKRHNRKEKRGWIAYAGPHTRTHTHGHTQTCRQARSSTRT